MSILLNPTKHRQVFSITVPMTLSGLSTPLLGMVDTAVMGHLDASYYLGAVAVGALVFSFLFWGFGFLRMAVTGLTARAYGANNNEEIIGHLYRGLALSGVIGLCLIGLQVLVIDLSLWLLESTKNVEFYLEQYLAMRIWAAPAALTNYVLLGWFLGIQAPRYTLYLLLLVNSVNIVLDVLFVVLLGWQVEGVALASVIAEYVGLIFGLALVWRYMKTNGLMVSFRQHFILMRFAELFRISGDIMVRTLCLIGSFAFFTLQGAKFGEATLAANAVLMNFQTFMAHGLDGFAHAAEALVGKNLGRKNLKDNRATIIICAFWSIVVALCFASVYAIWGGSMINRLTDLSEVRSLAMEYLPWLILAPVISVWGYLFDGIFVGAAWSASMRNTMLVSTVIFVLVWWVCLPLANHGLWLALMAFMLARGVSMAYVFSIRRHELMA